MTEEAYRQTVNGPDQTEWAITPMPEVFRDEGFAKVRVNVEEADGERWFRVFARKDLSRSDKGLADVFRYARHLIAMGDWTDGEEYELTAHWPGPSIVVIR